MRKDLTELVFIIDRSGSMSGLESDTIGGFNSMIRKQKQAEGEALISTVLFDNESEVLYDRVNVKDIQPMTEHDYTVRGTTALIDAIGKAIHHKRKSQEDDRAPEVKVWLGISFPGSKYRCSRNSKSFWHRSRPCSQL